jgi:hypothetical protein
MENRRAVTVSKVERMLTSSSLIARACVPCARGIKPTNFTNPVQISKPTRVSTPVAAATSAEAAAFTATKILNSQRPLAFTTQIQHTNLPFENFDLQGFSIAAPALDRNAPAAAAACAITSSSTTAVCARRREERLCFQQKALHEVFRHHRGPFRHHRGPVH